MNQTLAAQILAAQALANDPRVAQAKKLLTETLQDHQKTITSIRPANSTLKKQYEEMLSTFATYRGAKLWFPYLGSGIGNRCFVELMDGSVKYDFIIGIGPHYWGHSNPDLLNSSIDAALSDTIMQGNLQQNIDSFELVELLIKQSKMDHCFLTSTGAMAVENALKLLFQKKFPAKRILAFERCFMGRTLTLSQITDRPTYREDLPSNIFVDYVPFYDPSAPEASTKKALDILANHLKRYPKDYALMCFELIQGDGGYYAGTHDFFKAIMTLLKQHQVGIFVDEIQTFGRTPELFAYQYFQLQEFVDVVTVGKLSQVCATLFTKESKPLPGLLSQTFTGSTSAIHASKVIINGLIHNDYFGEHGKINKISAHFTHKLQKLSDRYPNLIEGPFGLGTMIAFTPFKGDPKRVTQFVLDLFDAGVMAFITGSVPLRVRFLVPAGVVTFDDIDEVMNIVEEVLTKG